jgi:hypothetical protein
MFPKFGQDGLWTLGGLGALGSAALTFIGKNVGPSPDIS